MTLDAAHAIIEKKTYTTQDLLHIYDTFSDDVELIGKIAILISANDTLCDDESAKVQLLEKLSTSSDMAVRWAVAKSHATPSVVLEKLSHDDVNLVRALVATNPNTPPSVLKRLFSDEKIVRDGLSGNPATPSDILKILSDASDKMVRLRVADNPSATKEILMRLAKDTEPNVARCATIKLHKMEQSA